jgi:hypothetical protein
VIENDERVLMALSTNTDEIQNGMSCFARCCWRTVNVLKSHSSNVYESVMSAFRIIKPKIQRREVWRHD